MSLTPVGFAIKLPEESRNTLIKEQGAKRLRYFPKGPVKKRLRCPTEGRLKRYKALRNWVKVSVEYVVSLPLPSKGSRK